MGEHTLGARSPHIASLDGIRAFSVALVFLAHAGLEATVPGGFGVTVFFFLSGYLITTLLRIEYDKNGHLNFWHFWLRRVLRILPPFYLVLSLAIALTSWLQPPGSLGLDAVVAQALHVTNYWVISHGYAGVPTGTGVYWSLAVEEHFYLAFPWIYVGMRRWDLPPFSQALVLWGICALILAWRCYLVLHLHAPIDRTYMGSDTRIDSILFGCALAVWRNPAIDAPPVSERFWKVFLVPASIAVLGLCFILRSDAFRETFRYTIQGVALTPVLYAAVHYRNWALFRALNLAPVAFFGVLSYSFYLVHYVVIFAVQALAPASGGFIRGVVSVLISLAISWVIYKMVELPCAQLRRRLTD